MQVDCETVATWIRKNSAESENLNWILANTKPCPKCKRPIEKNQGCMHMNCSQVRRRCKPGRYTLCSNGILLTNVFDPESVANFASRPLTLVSPLLAVQVRVLLAVPSPVEGARRSDRRLLCLQQARMKLDHECYFIRYTLLCRWSFPLILAAARIVPSSRARSLLGCRRWVVCQSAVHC